jgi:2-C-methyl-D-erythritol 2,4-cyclodiphosphate synthase
MLKIRSGIGYDIHRLEKGTGLLIGGITVASDLCCVAHSDGDVLIHALIDSLLGAAGEADIGEMFPDSDPAYKDISSAVLLKEALELLNQKQFEIVNIDCVLITQLPRISPFKEAIRKHMSALLEIPVEDFNVKAKTREKLGSVGRGEGIECYCVSMLRYTG